MWARVEGSAGCAEANVAGSGDRFGAGGAAEFGEHVGYVVADGFVGEEQLPGDLVVAAAAGDQVQDFPFPDGEFGKHGGGPVTDDGWGA